MEARLTILLQQSIATKVDASQVTYFQVGDLSSFKSGSGCASLPQLKLYFFVHRLIVPSTDELFLSDPNDASIVYCDSEIFAIGTAAVSVSTNQLPSASATDGNSTSSAAETSQSSDSASETDSSSSSSDSASITDSPSSSTDSSSSPTSSPTSSVSSPSLQAATVPGGAAEQGLNLLDSAATAVGPALMLALVAGAVAIFA